MPPAVCWQDLSIWVPTPSLSNCQSLKGGLPGDHRAPVTLSSSPLVQFPQAASYQLPASSCLGKTCSVCDGWDGPHTCAPIAAAPEAWDAVGSRSSEEAPPLRTSPGPWSSSALPHSPGWAASAFRASSPAHDPRCFEQVSKWNKIKETNRPITTLMIKKGCLYSQRSSSFYLAWRLIKPQHLTSAYRSPHLCQK